MQPIFTKTLTQTGLGKAVLGLASAALLSTGLSTAAQSQELTLCWAAWDPANALVELSKEFEAESGHRHGF